MPFGSEAELTEAVLANQSFWSQFEYPDWTPRQGREVEGLFGVPDLVLAYEKRNVRGQRQFRAFAFELKLSHWQRALVQAFRYAAFAHYVYVVMDAFYVNRALKKLGEFERCNVGLVSVSVDGAVKLHHRPRYRSPYSDQLRGRLFDTLASDVGDDLPSPDGSPFQGRPAPLTPALPA